MQKQQSTGHRPIPNVKFANKTTRPSAIIVSVCPKLTQIYKGRHNIVARAIHWDLSGKYGFQRNQRWYDHVPDSVLENEDHKILWDFSIRTDHEIEARRPDLLIINKRENNCQIIDVTIPDDGRVRAKEDKKVEKYQDSLEKSERYGA